MIAELGPEDMAAIVYIDRLGTPINFTRDRARLLAATRSPVLGVPSVDSDGFCDLHKLEVLLLVARVLDATGRAVASIPAELSPQAFTADRVADYRVELPLASGEYLLTITSTLGGTTVTRSARVRISQARP